MGNADTSCSSFHHFEPIYYTLIIAVDEKKNVYQVMNHDAYTGENDYVPIEDLTAFLTDLRNRQGTEIAIDVAAYRTVPVNTVIEIFDKCQIQGFTHTRVRLGSKPYEANTVQ